MGCRYLLNWVSISLMVVYTILRVTCRHKNLRLIYLDRYRQRKNMRLHVAFSHQLIILAVNWVNGKYLLMPHSYQIWDDSFGHSDYPDELAVPHMRVLKIFFIQKVFYKGAFSVWKIVVFFAKSITLQYTVHPLVCIITNQ